MFLAPRCQKRSAFKAIAFKRRVGQRDGRKVRHHAVENDREIVHRLNSGAVLAARIDSQLDGGHPAFQILHQIGVSGFQVRMRHDLADIPWDIDIIGKGTAAHERRAARNAGRVRRRGPVTVAVERLDGDTVAGLAFQCFRAFALQCFLNKRAPLGFIRIRKSRAERRQRVVSHVSFPQIMCCAPTKRADLPTRQGFAKLFET